MKARKTISVELLKNELNARLALSTLGENEKMVLCEVMEMVLHEARAYRGYNDNYWTTKGYKEWMAVGHPEGKEKDLYIYGPTLNKFNRNYY